MKFYIGNHAQNADDRLRGARAGIIHSLMNCKSKVCGCIRTDGRIMTLTWITSTLEQIYMHAELQNQRNAAIMHDYSTFIQLSFCLFAFLEH